MKTFILILLTIFFFNKINSQSCLTCNNLNACSVSTLKNINIFDSDIDINGNIYVTGWIYRETVFGTDTIGIPYPGWSCKNFVAKMDSNKNWLWAYDLGTTEVSYDIATLKNGKGVYVLHKGDEHYLAYISEDGSVVWTEDLGSLHYSGPNESAVVTSDYESNAILINSFAGKHSFGNITLNTGSVNKKGIFVAKINQSKTWMWAKMATSNKLFTVGGVKCDSSNNIFINGAFTGTADFITNSYTSKSGWRAFTSKLSNSGEWQWTKSEEYGIPKSIQVNKTTGDIYNISSKGFLLSKYNSEGSFQWQIDNPGIIGRDVVTDNSNNIYFTGKVKSDIMIENTLINVEKGDHIIIGEINSDGNWSCVKVAGGKKNSDVSYSILSDNSNNIFISGYSTSFNPIFDNITIDNDLGHLIMFIAQYSNDILNK